MVTTENAVSTLFGLLTVTIKFNQIKKRIKKTYKNTVETGKKPTNWDAVFKLGCEKPPKNHQLG